MVRILVFDFVYLKLNFFSFVFKCRMESFMIKVMYFEKYLFRIENNNIIV